MGTAVAFVLTQEAMLAAAPVVLPLIALYASRQRERLAAAAESEAQLARLEALLIELQGEAADEVAAEVGEEVAELLRAAQAAAARQAAGGGAAATAEAQRLLAALEGKLSAIEGSVLSTGRHSLANTGVKRLWVLRARPHRPALASVLYAPPFMLAPCPCCTSLGLLPPCRQHHPRGAGRERRAAGPAC